MSACATGASCHDLARAAYEGRGRSDVVRFRRKTAESPTFDQSPDQHSLAVLWAMTGQDGHVRRALVAQRGARTAAGLRKPQCPNRSPGRVEIWLQPCSHRSIGNIGAQRRPRECVGRCGHVIWRWRSRHSKTRNLEDEHIQSGSAVWLKRLIRNSPSRSSTDANRR